MTVQVRAMRPQDTLYMHGELNGVEPQMVLQSAGMLSRQAFSVVFYDRSNAPLGAAVVKAGRLLGVSLEGTEDALSMIEAMGKLLRQPIRRYAIHKGTADSAMSAPPLPLNDVLLACAADTGPTRLPPRASPPNPPPTSRLSPTSGPRGLRLPSVRSPAHGLGRDHHPRAVSTPRSEASANDAVTESDKPPAVFGRTEPSPIVAVVSPKGGAGKTTIALNVALSMAQAGHRVLIVDTDPNGDILSALNARDRANAGIYDALSGQTTQRSLLVRTRFSMLTIMPAHAGAFPLALAANFPPAEAFRAFLRRFQTSTDVIVVDTPAGLIGPSFSVLQACTHVVGVLEDAAIARRSFEGFVRMAQQVSNFPRVLGVVRSQAESAAPREGVPALPDAWCFRTAIPKSAALVESAAEGMPVGLLRSESAPAVSEAFAALADEMLDRLGLVDDAAVTRTFVV